MNIAPLHTVSLMEHICIESSLKFKHSNNQFKIVMDCSSEIVNNTLIEYLFIV